LQGPFGQKLRELALARRVQERGWLEKALLERSRHQAEQELGLLERESGQLKDLHCIDR